MVKIRFAHAKNKGLTVKLNFWSLDKYKDRFNSQQARHHIKGQALNIGTGKAKFFRDAGELLTTISGWQAKQLNHLKKGAV